MKHQQGFALLIELLMVMSILAILGLLAIPSYMHHNNLMMLRKTVSTFQWGMMNYPNLPVDPTWTSTPELNASTDTITFSYAKTFTQPAGTLGITPPAKIGGAWSCSFSDPSYSVNCN